MLRLKIPYWTLVSGIRSGIRRFIGSLNPFFETLVSQLAIGIVFFSATLRFRIQGGRARCASRSSAAAAPKRLLAISYYSTAHLSLFGTQRLAKFIKYLSRRNWNVTLITAAPKREDERDPEPESLPDTLRELRIECPQFPPFSNAAIWVPDNFIGWIKPAMDAAQAEIANNRPDVVFATVPPYSNCIAAALLAIKHRVPLVVDFRDPWSRIDTGWILSNPFSRWLTGRFETGVLKISDRIVMADDAAYASDFFALTGKEMNQRVVSILNGYDEEDFGMHPESSPLRSSAKFQICYVGTMYDEDTFLGIRALVEAWARGHPAEFADVEFHYAGPSSAIFDRCGFRPRYLVDHGYLSHRAAVALRFESHLQLFSQPVHFKPHVRSGKIYEMMRTRVPIIAITDPNGSVAKMLAATRSGVVVDNNAPEGGVEAVRRFYVAWKEGRQLSVQDAAAVRTYSREAQAGQLAAVLSSAALTPSREKAPSKRRHSGRTRR